MEADGSGRHMPGHGSCKHSLLTPSSTIPLSAAVTELGSVRKKPVALGGLVLKRSMDVVLAGLVFSVSIPLLAFSAVLFKLDSGSLAIFHPIRMRRRSGLVKQPRLQLAEEFEFERAIEAYEELIDSTFKQRRA